MTEPWAKLSNCDGDDATAVNVQERIQRRRRTVAWTATAVSLLLHAILFLGLPGLRLFEFIRPKTQKWPKSLHIEEIRTPPVRRVQPALPDKTAPGAPDRRTAPARDVLSFRQVVDESAIQPKAIPPTAMIGETRTVARPEVKPTAANWDPRPEIVEIQKPILADSVAAIPRRIQPLIERSRTTADILPPADISAQGGPPSPRIAGTFDNLLGEIGLAGDLPGGTGMPPEPRNPTIAIIPQPTQTLAAVAAPAEPSISSRPIEDLLKLTCLAATTPLDPGYVYCKLSIERAGAGALPVLPKDIVLVQDCSASITEQKLHFCREGMIRALTRIGPNDRFNVVGFRDTLQSAFPTWTPKTPEALEKAEAFIREMRSSGNTDFYGSVRFLLGLERDPNRPTIAILVSDGAPTRGLTDSTDIIEAFSRANAGTLSIFTLGTYAGANAYLLDLLSYRNRGDTVITSTGRWDIPAIVENRTREVRRPVLTGLQFVFAADSGCQAYPLLTSNLYLDRPLVVFARVPKATRNLLFQAVGRAGEISCDMIFNVDLAGSHPEDKTIPSAWAWQRIYHLIGVYMRSRSPTALDEIKGLAKRHRLKVPYENWLSP
jgi:hypothetical protein